MLVEFHHESSSLVPMGCHFGGEIAAFKNGLDNAGRESGAIQRSFVFWDGNEFVDQGFLLYDVVGFFVVVGVLEFVGLFAEKGFPQGGLDHEEDIQQLGFSSAGSVAYKN